MQHEILLERLFGKNEKFMSQAVKQEVRIELAKVLCLLQNIFVKHLCLI